MLTDNFVTMEIGKAEIKKYYRDISSAEQEQQPV